MYWYHKETKHSYYSVRSNPNQMDWALQPSTYKNYPNSFEKIEIDNNKPWHSVIYYTASISTKKYYPTGTHRFLRVNPSAGALYPNELYFQARGIEGFRDGIYHYEVETNRAVLLHILKGTEGIEPYMGHKTAMKGLLFWCLLFIIALLGNTKIGHFVTVYWMLVTCWGALNMLLC